LTYILCDLDLLSVWPWDICPWPWNICPKVKQKVGQGHTECRSKSQFVPKSPTYYSHKPTTIPSEVCRPRPPHKPTTIPSKVSCPRPHIKRTTIPTSLKCVARGPTSNRPTYMRITCTISWLFVSRPIDVQVQLFTVWNPPRKNKCAIDHMAISFINIACCWYLWLHDRGQFLDYYINNRWHACTMSFGCWNCLQSVI
jgi:hypothetical protein